MKASVAGRGAQAGFSLIELMIALVVTMIVTGSIYGLMATGGNAFKRDPEITDRQQNLRIALDLITRDVDIGGVRMGAGSQVFTHEDPDGLLDGGGEPNHLGGNSDILEIAGNNGECPDVMVDRSPDPKSGGTGVIGSGKSVNLMVHEEPPDCIKIPGFILIEHDNGATKPAWAHTVPSDDRVNFAIGQQPDGSGISDSDDFSCGQALSIDDAGSCAAADQYPLRVLSYQKVRYLIWDDDDGVPSLWRNDSGGIDPDTDAYADPPGGRWQLVARGIEDLQVLYQRESNGTANDQSLDWFDTPGTVDGTATNLDTIVRQVRITVSARTVARGLQGSTSASDGPDAIRGDMTTVVAPRAAHFHLSRLGDMPWR